MKNGVHHIEFWTTDLTATAGSFDWLLGAIGWTPDDVSDWPNGRIWTHPTGVYIVLEQSPDVSGHHERTHAGLNHLALRVDDRTLLDRLRREFSAHGWSEMFGESYPHAGGSQHAALFLENSEGFEVELVAG